MVMVKMNLYIRTIFFICILFVCQATFAQETSFNNIKSITIVDLQGNISASNSSDNVTKITHENMKIHKQGNKIYITGKGDLHIQSNCHVAMNISIKGDYDIKLNNICNKLSIATTGKSNIMVNRSTVLTSLDLSGDSIAEFKHINGRLNIFAKGKSNLLFEKGHVQSIDANLRGTHKIFFSGKADKSNLSIVGDGEIIMTNLRRIENKYPILGDAKIVINQRYLYTGHNNYMQDINASHSTRRYKGTFSKPGTL